MAYRRAIRANAVRRAIRARLNSTIFSEGSNVGLIGRVNAANLGGTSAANSIISILKGVFAAN